MAKCCEFGDKLPVSMKCGEFLELLRSGWLLRKDCVPCS
jgi:hypothetical protein